MSEEGGLGFHEGNLTQNSFIVGSLGEGIFYEHQLSECCQTLLDLKWRGLVFEISKLKKKILTSHRTVPVDKKQIHIQNSQL